MLLFAASYPAFPQTPLAGKIVSTVSYQPASQPIDPRDLTAMQLVEVGKPLDPEQVGTTIDHLFSSGLYDDIQVDAEPSGSGVAVRFITVARRFVGHIDIQGHISSPPNRGVLLSETQLYLGTPYDPDDVETAKQNLGQLLRDNGLFSGDVGRATLTDPATNQVTISFLVNSGKRARYQTPTIHGDPKLPVSTIIRATGWRIPLIHRWRYISQQLTDKGTDGIQKKYLKQNRYTASVDLESMDFDPKTNRATPTLNINAGPKINIKAIEAKLSTGKLRTLVPIFQEGSVDNDLLAEGAHNIQNYFQSRGYPDVEVTYKQEPEQNGQETINYYIALGVRRRLVHIDIKGGSYFKPETLRERMFLQTNSLLLRYGRYSETFRHSDENAIENLYAATGFRDVQVKSSVQTNYKNKPNDLAVTFEINQGALWSVGKLQILGARLDLSEIRNQFYSIEGQPFADVNVASDRNRILEFYNDHGFLRAQFRYKVEPGAEPHTVNLTYTITEGPQEFVRGVILSGLNRTKPKLAERYVNLEDGQPVSMSSINEISRKLTDLGIFSTVNAALQNPNGANRYKYVLYDFDEAARYSFNVGLGLQIGQFGHTTDNLSHAGGAKGVSPIISFNVNRLNFLGVGQTLSLQTRYSTLEQRESLSYIVPRLFGSERVNVVVSALYDTTQDVQTFSSRRQQASVQTSQRLNKASTIAERFDYRRVSTDNIVIPSLLVPLYSQPVRIGMFSASYIRDHRDNSADAHRGSWNTLDAGIAGKFFGSQRSFVRVLARNATYYPLGRFVLARQTQIGAILPFDVPQGLTSYEAIPLPERFFGGGSVSMRGFGDNQAGPRDIGAPGAPATGFPIGGNALFFNNVELRFPLLGPNITGVFFEDMGNIYTTFSDISFAYHQPPPAEQNFNYAVQAAGFGIRYKTPLGPIRVDLSYALNPPRYEGFSTSTTTQDLLNCGTLNTTPACTPGPQRLSHFNFFFSIGQAF
ncbi:MAG TPA: POTRA domain-containing protein [Bryobacteraceae bacterium]|nr:POTRA domain-containing protein [Bryobacteraceae bacterium]